MSTVLTYTTNSSWTVPVGVSEIQVEVWGSGGNGGSGNNWGGGGGGGGYAKVGSLPVTVGDTYDINLVPADSRGDGFEFAKGFTVIVRASGGHNGGDGSYSTAGLGGAGGSGSIGDLTYSGGHGASGDFVIGVPGGGGGAAGVTSNGSPGSGSSGGSGGTFGGNGGDANHAGYAPGGGGGGNRGGSGGKCVLTYTRAVVSLDAETGVFTLAGPDVTFGRTYRLNAATAQFNLSFKDAILNCGYRMDAETGAFTLVGNDAALSRTYCLLAETGRFNLVGPDKELSYSEATVPDPFNALDALQVPREGDWRGLIRYLADTKRTFNTIKNLDHIPAGLARTSVIKTAVDSANRIDLSSLGVSNKDLDNIADNAAQTRMAVPLSGYTGAGRAYTALDANSRLSTGTPNKTVDQIETAVDDSLKVDITGLNADSAPDAAADYVVAYDASATANKKVLISNLGGGLTWSVVSDATNAVDKNGYVCDTSGAAFTLTLPGSPAAGAQVYIADGTGSFAAKNLTVGRNGLKIMGLAEDMIIATNNIAIGLVYSDATNGWRIA